MAAGRQTDTATTEHIGAFGQVLAAALALEARQRLRDNEALQEANAPKSLTGCVSALSSCAAVDDDYAHALKDYAEVYQQFQAYLAPDDTLDGHDYDRAIAMSVPENAYLGCLNNDMVEFVAAADAVSDEEIESCGYLGWLQH